VGAGVLGVEFEVTGSDIAGEAVVAGGVAMFGVSGTSGCVAGELASVLAMISAGLAMEAPVGAQTHFPLMFIQKPDWIS
jgi:hypothetical protein